MVPEPAPSLSPIIEEKIPQEPPLQEPPTISRPVEKKMPPVVAAPKEAETIKAKADALQGLKVIGKIELPVEKKKEKLIASSDQNKDRKKRPRKRIPNNEPPAVRAPLAQGARPPAPTTDRTRGRDLRKTEELTDKEIQDKIKSTLAKLSGGGTKGVTANRSKYRKEKRSAKAEEEEEKIIQQAEDDKTLKVTEFISASDLASLMNVTINQVI